MILTPQQLAERSRIYLGSCHDALEVMGPSSVSLVVTSPPYDGLRTYKGKWSIDLARLGDQLYRVVTEGGVVAMVIGDQTSDFAKSITTHRMIVDWVDRVGWKMFECCLYRREACPGKWWEKRFRVDHEFIPIFFRGRKPKHFDKSSLMKLSKSPGKTMRPCRRGSDGELIEANDFVCAEKKCRGTVWDILSSSTEGNENKNLHPAPFPDRLAEDLVRCFSAPGDLVLDPFLGSGTTAVVAAKHGRRFAGCEIAPEYVEIAKSRLYAESPIDPGKLRVEDIRTAP